ncbi:metal-dependent hydrolase [Candidatus Riflebacteria bacterium]
MNPITHFLVGWNIANLVPPDRGDRALICIASVIPDIDSVGIVFDFFNKNTSEPTTFWEKYHHVLGHNLGFALLVAFVCVLLARSKIATTLLALLSFHFHILGDIVGARGPDGFQWPVHYLLPFSDGMKITWEGQWALNAWPNLVLTAILLLTTFYLAWYRGFSPLEILSLRWDTNLVETLRKRFGTPQ